MDEIIKGKKQVSGEITVPGDKSISHRAVMLGAISDGTTYITNFLHGEDCIATIDCFKKLGIEIDVNNTCVTVKGKGLNGLKQSEEILYTANSGTTTRLLSGMLAGQSFTSKINGDGSIQKRPMNRIILPLSQMGADISSVNGCCPLTIKGGGLKGIDYTLPVASAQVKSSILLAGLYAEGQTTVRENTLSRNHTEIMLKALGADICVNGNAVTVKRSNLFARDIAVPSDISSAAYFIVLALISQGGELLIKNAGVNSTRTGIIDALKLMGGNIELLNIRNDVEPTADIYVKSSKLNGANIGGDIIPRLIDEIPVLAVAAMFAEGQTVISGASELKYKETNRINTTAAELSKCGAQITPTDDGLIIKGGGDIKAAVYSSHGDHRIAMSAAIAAAFAEGESTIKDAECAAVSYPSFFDDLKRVLI